MNGLRGTAILVSSANLDAPDRVATLFLLAQSCAALDQETELFFTGPAVRLLERANQDLLVGYGTQPRSLARYLEDTAAAGVRLYACTQAMHALGLPRQALVPHCAGWGGIVQFAARCGDPHWRVLVF